MYMVTSKPKRMSLYSGVSHFMVFLQLSLMINQELFVVDIHGNFEAKTDIAVFRCFPFHSISPDKV